MKRIKRPSVKSQIEGTPEVRERELLWVKKHRENLVLVKAKSNRTVVDSKTYKELVNAFPESHFFIHQHLSAGKTTYTRKKGAPPDPYVSPQDIGLLSTLMMEGKAKTGIIAGLDKNGKVVGYNIFKINKPFPRGSLSLMAEISKVRSEGREITDHVFNDEIIVNSLKRIGVTLKQKFVPMPGYRFDKKTRIFLRVRKKAPKN